MPAAPVLQVLARPAARSSSSARISATLSDRRRGSTTARAPPAPSRPGTTSGRSTSHGHHDSIPSKKSPSASRSHCSRPHGWLATRPAARRRIGPSGRSLPGRVDLEAVQGVRGPLVADRELHQPIDVVTPEVDANRRRRRRGVDIDDGTSNGHLPAVLHLVLPVVAELRQAPHQRRLVEGVADAESDRGGGLTRRHELGHGPGRGDHHRRRRGLLRHPVQDPAAPSHGVDRRADPLEGQGLPCRQLLDLVGAQEGGQVRGKRLRLRPGRHRDQQRSPA